MRPFLTLTLPLRSTRRARPAIVLCALSALLLAGNAFAAGDPAWPGNHPLTQAQTGALLISDLRCAACHEGVERGAVADKAAPDLAEVGARVSPAYLRKFLAAPESVHPGTTMPDVLAARPSAERAEIAEALTHFLVAQSPAPFVAQRPEPKQQATGEQQASAQEQGKSLYHTVGCVACHGPRALPAGEQPMKRNDELEEEEDPAVQARKAIKPSAVPLAHVGEKYSVQSLGQFLFQPLRVRPAGRMPDLKLTPAEAQAIASYLHADAPVGESADEALVPQASLVAKGREYFRQLNCAACHAVPGIDAAPRVSSLSKADLGRGCLSPTTDRSPRFSLAEPQRVAIQAALRAAPQQQTDALVIAQTFTAFRCIACHVRDDYGGVPEAYSPYFVGSEQKLGDDGRIPPPLTLLGAKLQPAWLHKVLFDGESVRPYLATRMPQYGSANLQHLPPVLARLDEQAGKAVLSGKTLNIPSAERRTEPERAREKLLRAGGRELLGDKGLNCVACHTFNGKATPGSQGIDLVTTTQRLQPDWFNSYVRNPGAFRPRTVMPSAWSNGIAAHKTILNGDTDTQIEAIWYYLSLGTSAADPPGIRAVNTKLTVDQQAITFRGRSRVAGFRGIAVGLPEKLSYAFNAETGTLSAIWQGDFLNVNWSGQGSGDFQPASEHITLAQDVSFAALASDEAPWPLLPVMTKEAKTNPNPLYPKNVGYQFRGYYLGERGIPTFQYRSGTLEIEDRSTAVTTSESARLKRVLQLESPVQQTVWLRALTGEIQQESEHVYRSGRLRLTIPPSEVKLRSLAADPPRSELLLRLQIPQGKTTLEFHYEPLKK
jgi:mono/diheme cytochrome c family protein